MRNLLVASLFPLCAVALAFLPSAASAQSVSPETAVGTPDVDGGPTGWYLFRGNGDDGIHLHTHGPGAEHDFIGILRTSGTFDNVTPVRLERGDNVQVLDGGHELAIHFHTYDYTDGVDFVIRGGERLRLNLELDGQETPTSEIYLGEDLHNPAHDPFTFKV